MRFRVVLAVVSVALLGFAPAPFPKAERSRGDDRTDVGGTWEFVSAQSNGSEYQVNYVSEMKREQFAFVWKDQPSRTVYVMRLDPNASPPSFTWSQNNQVMYVGSYRLRKDEMTMIFTGGNSVAARPTDFEGKAAFRYVLRRVKRG
jgi:uncharacterized protein (TIGR03067 family)